jgi:hypothetical protein
MARKPKKTKTTEAATESDVRPAISQRKLRELMSSARKAQNNISEISGGLGSEIKLAVEKNHLHRKAFRIIVQADRMEPEKLADFFDCLDHYRDISGLNERAASAERLPMPEGEADEEEADAEPENVHQFPTQSAVAAE